MAQLVLSGSESCFLKLPTTTILKESRTTQKIKEIYDAISKLKSLYFKMDLTPRKSIYLIFSKCFYKNKICQNKPLLGHYNPPQLPREQFSVCQKPKHCETHMPGDFQEKCQLHYMFTQKAPQQLFSPSKDHHQ